MGRACTICEHERRPDIDAALVAGESFRAIAARTGTAPSSLVRHKSEHLAMVVHVAEALPLAVPERRAGTRETAIVAQATAPAASLVEQATTLRDRAMALLEQVERGIPLLDADGKPIALAGGAKAAVVDFKAGANLIGQARACLELEAKLLGELGTGGTTVNILQAPQWIELRDVILGALGPHPDALAAVAAAMESHLERRLALPGGSYR